MDFPKLAMLHNKLEGEKKKTGRKLKTNKNKEIPNKRSSDSLDYYTKIQERKKASEKSSFSRSHFDCSKFSNCSLDSFTNELNPRSLEKLEINVKVDNGDGGNSPVLITKLKSLNKEDNLDKKESTNSARMRWREAGRKIITLNKTFRQFKQVRETIRLLGVSNKYSINQLNENKKESKSTCIFLPDSVWKLSWNIVMITLLLFTAIYVPYRVAFVETAPIGWLVVEYFVDILFLTDIIVNFLSAYLDGEHNLITSKKKIAINYLKGWFLIDIVACIPFQFFSESNDNTQYNKLFRLLRLGRLYRLIRMFAFLRMSKFFKQNKTLEKALLTLKLNAGIKRLLIIILMLLFLLHLFACLWFFFAKFNDFHPDCWVVRYGYRDSSNATQYFTSLFWVTTLISVGYAHIFPGTTTEQILSLFFMISGVAFYTYALGTITSILSSSDNRNEKMKSKLLALDEIAQTYKIPHDLYFKVKKIIKNNSESSYYSMVDHSEIMEELPGSIKSELKSLIYAEPLKKIQFFQNKDPLFINMMLPALRRISLEKGDIIFKAKDWADEGMTVHIYIVYFLMKGRVDLVTRSGISFIYYIDGSYFGEVEILSEKDFRDFTAIAHEKCEILAISRDMLLDILEKFPLVHDEMNRILSLRKIKNIKSLDNATKSNLIIDTRSQRQIESPKYRKAGHRSSLFRKKSLRNAFSTENIHEILEFEEEKEENNNNLKVPVSPTLSEHNWANSTVNQQNSNFLMSQKSTLKWSKGVLESESPRKAKNRRNSCMPFANEAIGKNVEENYIKKIQNPDLAHQSLELENFGSWKDTSPRKPSTISDNSDIENAEITATQVELLTKMNEKSIEYIEQPSVDNPNESQIIDNSMNGLNVPQL